MSEQPLLIRTYGEYRMEYSGKDITDVLSRKSIGMIIYMLCSSGMKVSKNSLKELLWVDTTDEKAAYNLRFNLWNIKKAIPDIDGNPFIISERGMCRINSNYPFQIYGLNELISLNTESKSFEEVHEIIDNVIKLSHGTSFMEHFYIKDCDDFNDWLMLERNDRDQKLIQALIKIEKYFYEAEDYDTAINIVERLIVISPFDEDLRIIKMKMLIKMGRQFEAIKEYKNYCSVLKNELGMKPSQQIRNIYNEATYNATSNEYGYLQLTGQESGELGSFIEFMENVKTKFAEKMVLEINEWDSIDEKSKEVFITLSKRGILDIKYAHKYES